MVESSPRSRNALFLARAPALGAALLWACSSCTNEGAPNVVAGGQPTAGENTGSGSGGGDAAGGAAVPISGGGGATSSAGGSAVGGGSGTSSAGTGGAGGSGGSGVVPMPADVELATSIPGPYAQPLANPGQLSERSYSCYYYTDDKEQLRANPRELVLERRVQPITKELNVYTPPGYDTAQRYPVVYVLHGITDNQDTWLERGDPNPTVLLDNLIAKGDVRPLLAVFPNGNSNSDFLDRNMSNQAGYYYFASELVGDIIPFIEKEYSVIADRDSRGLCGFSMGGMQTINAGMCQSLEHFAWFGAFAAAPTTYASENIAEYLGWENEASSLPVRYFYNMVGDQDSVAGASQGAAVNGLTDKTEYLTDESFVFHEVPGAHNYGVSSIGLYNFLRISFPP